MLHPTREFTVIAQDPQVRRGGRILRARLRIPAESPAPGPRGARVHVIDYDASADRLYVPWEGDDSVDPFEDSSDDVLLTDPRFHAQNVYAIVMATLARFERALGRRVEWGFKGHQIKIAPHAFADANAFYSGRDHGLMFGYFPARNRRRHIFTCLSHDIVAHETTHALLDGLRERYTDPSSPDQAAFHEGFSDIVALLSVFAQREVVKALLLGPSRHRGRFIDREALMPDALRRSALAGLASEMGDELGSVRGALRRSVDLIRRPDRRAVLDQPEFIEPHRRGEVLVSAVLNAFIDLWSARCDQLVGDGGRRVDLNRAVEEGHELAERLLTICIRALDYAPPVDVKFEDYLCALLTADRAMYPDDWKYGIRKRVRRSFETFGIDSPGTADSDGCWQRPKSDLAYERLHFEPLQRSKDEVYRFLWANREELEVHPAAWSAVISVRPAVRVGADGFILRETVAEYIERLDVPADQLRSFPLRTSAGDSAGRLRPPRGMPREQEITLFGGGALIFNEFGKLKFHIKNHLDSRRQQERLDYLWDAGFFDRGGRAALGFDRMHLLRASGAAGTWRLRRGERLDG